MLIDFNNEKYEAYPEFKGGTGLLDGKMFFDGTNRIMLGRLEKNSTIGFHKHETSSEIIYILEGTGRVKYDDGEEKLSPGVCHYCPKGHSHGLINDTEKDLVFLAVVPEQ